MIFWPSTPVTRPVPIRESNSRARFAPPANSTHAWVVSLGISVMAITWFAMAITQFGHRDHVDRSEATLDGGLLLLGCGLLASGGPRQLELVDSV